MRKDPRKIVAAAMGVIQYLDAERERSRKETAAVPQAPSSTAPRSVHPQGSLWAAIGRMEMMRFRNLMELRAFRRGR
jgi:hypothetical protein